MRSRGRKRVPRIMFFLFDRHVSPVPMTARPQMGNHTMYAGDKPCRKVGRTRDAVGPVVATDNCEVAVPLAVGITELGLRTHVGARAGMGETEQLSETGPSNPYIPVAVSVKTAELPAFIAALPGVALTAKSLTTWVKTAEVAGLKLTSPRYSAVMSFVPAMRLSIEIVATPFSFKFWLPRVSVPSTNVIVPVGVPLTAALRLA